MTFYKLSWKYGDQTWTFDTREEAEALLEQFVVDDIAEFGAGYDDDYYITPID